VAGDPIKTEIQQAQVELDQGLKSCRSMLNDYRAALTGEHAAHEEAAEDHSSAVQWRTQEDSNL
jgi:hypothetical protein